VTEVILLVLSLGFLYLSGFVSGWLAHRRRK
jgi:hypothetical protein